MALAGWEEEVVVVMGVFLALGVWLDRGWGGRPGEKRRWLKREPGWEVSG